MADFLQTGLGIAVLIAAQSLLIVAFVMISLLFLVYGDRKIWAAVQMRRGPNVVGPFGLLQSFADLLKFVLKEIIIPAGANKTVFLLAPVITLTLALVGWAVIPVAPGWVVADLNVGVLYLFAISSLGVYGIIMGGWASNSKYPFLGSVRASAQLISYELSMTLAVLPVFLWVNAPGLPGTMSFGRVVEFQSQPGFLGGMWFGFLMPLSAFIFLVALFAETNRQPFDTVESESDLVGSFHTEYGAFKWGLFFVAEYSHMIVGSGVFMLLFGGGWNPLPWVSLATAVDWLGAILPFAHAPLFVGVLSIAIFLGKTLAMIFFFMWVRWTVPRFRYDQVMKIGWQKMLPLSIANLLFYAIAIAVLQK